MYQTQTLFDVMIVQRALKIMYNFHSWFNVQGRCWRPPSRQNHHVRGVKARYVVPLWMKPKCFQNGLHYHRRYTFLKQFSSIFEISKISTKNEKSIFIFKNFKIFKMILRMILRMIQTILWKWLKNRGQFMHSGWQCFLNKNWNHVKWWRRIKNTREPGENWQFSMKIS